MDLKPFKLDIDDLIGEFSRCGSAGFAKFKTVWLSKKFSYVFEARPSNHGFFMQSLYAHCIGHMFSTGPIETRFGGLYCLYTLYETQPYKPPYKIYLSLGESRKMKALAIEAKAVDVKVVRALIKNMIEKNVFLFGSVGADERSAADTVNEVTDMQNAHVQAACKKLFSDSRLEHFINLDMGTELNIEEFKRESRAYASAKNCAIKEAIDVVDVENIKHIAEDKTSIGDAMEKIAADWNSQKALLYEQTGFNVGSSSKELQSSERNAKRKGPCDDDLGVQDDDCIGMDDDQDDAFGKELEEAVLLEPSECQRNDKGKGPCDGDLGVQDDDHVGMDDDFGKELEEALLLEPLECQRNAKGKGPCDGDLRVQDDGHIGMDDNPDVDYEKELEEALLLEPEEYAAKLESLGFPDF